MTLIQTRVDSGTASAFDKVARERGMTTYSLLQQLVIEATRDAESEGWEKHRAKIDALENSPVSFNTVAHDRQQNNER